MSAIVKVTLGEVESVYRCTYPLARALEVILHHSNCAEEIKQEPKTDVLDKIRAEIEENISHYEHFLSSNTANGLMIAKKIIDKYRESENKG